MLRAALFARYIPVCVQLSAISASIRFESSLSTVPTYFGKYFQRSDITPGTRYSVASMFRRSGRIDKLEQTVNELILPRATPGYIYRVDRGELKFAYT